MVDSQRQWDGCASAQAPAHMAGPRGSRGQGPGRGAERSEANIRKIIIRHPISPRRSPRCDNHCTFRQISHRFATIPKLYCQNLLAKFGAGYTKFVCPFRWQEHTFFRHVFCVTHLFFVLHKTRKIIRVPATMVLRLWNQPYITVYIC